jgi:hypothetical protein
MILSQHGYCQLTEEVFRQLYLPAQSVLNFGSDCRDIATE